jgi:hypothetical protein
MATLQSVCQLAKDWTKKNFGKFAVVAWTTPVEGHYGAWSEDSWLALALSFRLKLRPHSVWKNGKRVNDEGIDRFTLEPVYTPKDTKHRKKT